MFIFIYIYLLLVLFFQRTLTKPQFLRLPFACLLWAYAGAQQGP